MKIFLWNVNRRLDVILKRHSPIQVCTPKLKFLLESSMGYDILPSIKNYAKFADQNVRTLDYGGIVAYVENSLAPHVFDVKYNTCFISFVWIMFRILCLLECTFNWKDHHTLTLICLVYLVLPCYHCAKET